MDTIHPKVEQMEFILLCTSLLKKKTPPEITIAVKVRGESFFLLFPTSKILPQNEKFPGDASCLHNFCLNVEFC